MMDENDLISKNDVRPGDMILYVLDEKPRFKPFTKDTAWENFCVLIDRLIIAMGGSMCTHAALAASDPDTVVEATLPYCRYRPGIYVDGYSVVVRRVAAEGKGGKVLDFVPAGIDPDAKPEDNLPYAYAQSAVAALLCLFRREAPLEPAARDALLVMLQLMLHPLAKKIDDFIAERQGKDGAWFCSQLVAYCYDEAAKTDSDYALHFPALDAAKESLIEWLLGQASPDAIQAIADQAGLRSTEKRPTLDIAGAEIAHAGMKLLAALERDEEDVRGFLEGSGAHPKAGTIGEDFLAMGASAPAMAEAVSLAKDHEKAAAQILADTFRLLSALGAVEPGKDPVDAFREYKESLIMPSDLECEISMREVGVLHDHS